MPPEWVKHEYIRRWANHTGYRVFVETGTYLATTTREVASAFATVHTIEYDYELFCRAQQSGAAARTKCGSTWTSSTSTEK